MYPATRKDLLDTFVYLVMGGVTGREGGGQIIPKRFFFFDWEGNWYFEKVHSLLLLLLLAD